MAEAEEKLNAKQAAALSALLSSPSVAEAAKKAGVGERTIWRYLSDPAFADEYRTARREVTQHTIMRLQARSSEAAEILFSIAKDKKAPASSRVSAARAIIEQAFDGTKTTELIERVDALQKAIEAQGGKGK